MSYFVRLPALECRSSLSADRILIGTNFLAERARKPSGSAIQMKATQIVNVKSMAVANIGGSPDCAKLFTETNVLAFTTSHAKAGSG